MFVALGRPLLRARRGLRAAAGIGGAVLVAFHGWLLGTQFAAGRLSDPGLVLRWLLALALVSALFALRRSGNSIWSRKGVAIWVLAALLHGPAVASHATDQFGALSLPEAAATVIAQLAATLVLGLWAFGQLTRFRAPLRITRAWLVVPVRVARAALHCQPFSPRPPPRR